MLKAGKLSAFIVATTITVLAFARTYALAQTPNVVIQWNQTLQTLFVERGPAFTFARCR